MNRYVLDGLAADLASGKSVYLVSARHTDAVRVLRLLADHMLDAKAQLAAGAERITHPSGGVVRVATAHSDTFRGVSPDVVVILDEYGLGPKKRVALAEAFEIIRAVRPLELIRF